jgi:hypothetical protein
MSQMNLIQVTRGVVASEQILQSLFAHSAPFQGSSPTRGVYLNVSLRNPTERKTK